MAVRIIFGANEEKVPVGSTVAQARDEYKEVLNISDEAVFLVNGEEVKEDYVLQEGDSLEFLKNAGDKG